jgi:dipeptidyl aminopeptidase/acylaminoacyl peptidase
MKKIILFLIINLLTVTIFAQLPNTDIWLLDIKIEKDSIQFTNLVNATNRVGYDNQPAFSPDGKYILYTSIRDGKQSDIYKYDLKTKITTQFTNTVTSEYSPTFMPDGKNISVVMVEVDSTQRLWKFPIKGGDPSLIMDKVDSIGYHCWLDNTHVALFLITNPMKLVFTDITTQKSIYIKDIIGRSMHFVKTSKGERFFYSYKGQVYSTNIDNSTIQPETALEFKAEDFTFLNDDQIIIGNGSQLYKKTFYSIGKDGLWKKISDLSSYGIKNITRIAVSPDGKKMAIVAESNP